MMRYSSCTENSNKRLNNPKSSTVKPFIDWKKENRMIERNHQLNNLSFSVTGSVKGLLITERGHFSIRSDSQNGFLLSSFQNSLSSQTKNFPISNILQEDIDIKSWLDLIRSILAESVPNKLKRRIKNKSSREQKTTTQKPLDLVKSKSAQSPPQARADSYSDEFLNPGWSELNYSNTLSRPHPISSPSCETFWLPDTSVKLDQTLNLDKSGFQTYLNDMGTVQIEYCPKYRIFMNLIRDHLTYLVCHKQGSFMVQTLATKTEEAFEMILNFSIENIQRLAPYEFASRTFQFLVPRSRAFRLRCFEVTRFKIDWLSKVSVLFLVCSAIKHAESPLEYLFLRVLLEKNPVLKNNKYIRRLLVTYTEHCPESELGQIYNLIFKDLCISAMLNEKYYTYILVKLLNRNFKLLQKQFLTTLQLRPDILLEAPFYKLAVEKLSEEWNHSFVLQFSEVLLQPSTIKNLHLGRDRLSRLLHPNQEYQFKRQITNKTNLISVSSDSSNIYPISLETSESIEDRRFFTFFYSICLLFKDSSSLSKLQPAQFGLLKRSRLELDLVTEKKGDGSSRE